MTDRPAAPGLRRRALVTGAGGFVGANLVRRLVADGHGVTAVVRPGGDPWRLDDQGDKVETAPVDLRDEIAVAELVRSVAPDWVFHLAAHGAYSWQGDSTRIVATNLLATVGLVDACLAMGCEAFVHAGSSSEYGLKDHPPTEDELPDPNSRYALAKASATLFCRYAARHEGLPAVTLRLYSVYGPYEDPRRLVPRLVSNGLGRRLPSLVGPHVARDFVWVDDVVEAFVAAAQRGRPGSVYNVGSGRQTTVGDLVELARKTMGITAAPDWGSMAERGWDTDTWVADAAAAGDELGWRAATPLEDGLAATVEWLSGRRDLWDRYEVGA